MKIPKVKNIIFDLDGVLADTDKGRYILLRDILLEYKINIEEIAVLKDLEGISTLKFLKNKFKNISEYHANIIAKRQKIFLSNLDKYCIPFPNIQKVIKKLNLKYILHIATTNDKEIAKILLTHLQIIDYFQNILGREITERKTEKIKDYNQVLKKLYLKSNECIVIEDSQVGVLAAKKENIFCIAFNHFSNPIILKSADIVVKNYNELENILCETQN